jgi:glycosyltransferase involved in cell wall biosynthesis
MTRKVAIIWRYLADYRVPFYHGLRDYLTQRDIHLELIYGETNEHVQADDVQIALPWANCVRHWSISVGGFEVCWQPYVSYIRDADLVIVEQANRLLLNYWLIAKRHFCRQKIAFWGHGRDLQTSSATLRNAWKKLLLKHVDWWFAYSAEVKEAIIKSAFVAERITNVQNAIDTDALRSVKAAMSAQQLDSLRKELRLGSGPVGIYCGRAYKQKRIDFFLKACFEIRKRIPSFEVIIVGSGPDQNKIIAAAQEAEWIHYVGPKYGDARVPYFLLSDVSLVPGAVGLAIVDCFALEVPLMTTQFPYHGPEISYLKNGENGLMTEDDLESYVAGVSGTLLDREELDRLKSGCRTAASIYTVKTMIENFGTGIVACLADDRCGLRPTGEHEETSLRLRNQGVPLSHKRDQEQRLRSLVVPHS